MERTTAEAQTRLAAVESTPDASVVQHLYGVWRRVLGNPRLVLNKERQLRFRQLLEAVGGNVQRAVNAIHGLTLSDWHMGRDSKTDGRQWTEPRYIVRHAEQFADNWERHLEQEANHVTSAAEISQEVFALIGNLLSACTKVQDDMRQPDGSFSGLTPLSEKRAAMFDPLLLPLGTYQFEGEVALAWEFLRESKAHWTKDDLHHERTALHRYSAWVTCARVARARMLAKHPCKILELAINRMIPKTKLGDRLKTNLFIYAGSQHPHKAQKPVLLSI